MAYTDIDKSSEYFRIKTYSGDGSDDRNITWDESSNMQPDMLWSKRRDSADNHSIYDIVRGSGLELRTQTTDADLSRTNNIQALQTNGFQVGTDGQVNASGGTYVSWGWLADNTSGSSNTVGDINSTVSANTTSGFSIVSYTGTGANATVGHGLGVAPSMIIVKSRSFVEHWQVYHASLGATKYMQLSTTEAVVTASTRWNDTAPTSSVFSIGNHGSVNQSSGTLIAYCFAEKKGFSKAFSYTGNGSSDGSYCHLGFKPSFILGKNSDNAFENWFIFDNKRDIYNTSYHQLFPNSSVAEGTNSAQNIDILSSGFKCRSVETRFNGSGNKIIGIAFAENPFVTSTGIPTTAR